MKNNLQNTAPIKYPISGCYFYTQKQLEKENKYEAETNGNFVAVKTMKMET